MFENKKEVVAFRLGVFFSELLLRGAIQPDFQIDNIGWRGNNPVLLDSADIVSVKLPEDLTKDLVRDLTESLFSLADSFEGSFIENSYLRAGIIFKAGVLGHMIYEAARGNGYSSFIYTEKSLRKSDHSLMRITKWTDIKSAIAEWIQISSRNEHDVVEPLEYPINVYYLDNSKYIFNLLDAIVTDNQEKEAMVIMNMAMSSLQFGMPYTAFGLAKKCKLISETPQVQTVSDGIVSQTNEYVADYKEVVVTYLDRDIFEFLWLLEDLDITVPEKK